ncbi:MAG: LCP family protein [Spirochaetales bacterium]
MKRLRRNKIDTGILFLIFVLGLLLSGGVYIYQQVRVDPLTTLIQEGKPIVVQIMVHDGKALQFTQLFFYNTSTGRGALLDVPNNLGVLLPKIRKVGRIDTLYKVHLIESFRDALEGVIEGDIPFYWELSYQQMERLIDLLGGIEVFIANSLQMDAEGKKIYLPAGNLQLDGGKAMVFLSFKDPEESEFDRILRFQKFLQSLFKKIGESVDFLRHPEVVPFLKATIKTDMELRGLLTFIEELKKLDTERITFQRVLGTVRSVETMELLFPHFEGQLLRQTIKKMVENLASTDAGKGEDRGITLEILNGTRLPGLARRTREIYQSFGYEVVSFGNAESQNIEKTVLLDRKGNPEGAARIASVIRCTNIVTDATSYSGSQSKADFTLVLGGDFDGRYCK